MQLSGSSGKDCSFENMCMGDVKEQRMQEPNLEFLWFLKVLFALLNWWVGFYIRLLLPKLVQELQRLEQLVNL